MLTVEEVKDIAQRWAEYPILQELAASHEALRADLAAAEQREKALVEGLAWALGEFRHAIPQWTRDDWDHYGPVVKARALLTPQPAEPSVHTDEVEQIIGKVIRWLDDRKLIYGGLGDELEAEKLIEDAKIGIGLVRYEVVAEPPEGGQP
jgi:hypothetical protein